MSVREEDRPVADIGRGCRGAARTGKGISADRRTESRDSQEARRVERAASPRLGAKTDRQLLADVQIHRKAVDYILRFPEEFFGPEYAAETIRRSITGIARAIELEYGTVFVDEEDRKPRARLSCRASTAACSPTG